MKDAPQKFKGAYLQAGCEELKTTSSKVDENRELLTILMNSNSNCIAFIQSQIDHLVYENGKIGLSGY